MKIVVTGSKGQLGSEIKELAKQNKNSFIFCDVEEMDLTNPSQIQSFLTSAAPDLIISCGAYTAVDKAEDETKLATQINAEAPKIIAELCLENQVRLIHISTDYVFDGLFDRPIQEIDLPCPKSVYGESKLLGEQHVNALLDNAYIIRTSWVYSTFANNFVKTILKLGRERSELNVVSDQIGTPTNAQDLARVILFIIDQIEVGNDHPGIYHYSNEGECSWYDFAVEIFKQNNVDCEVNPIPTSSYPTKAKRPNYSVLDKTKIKNTYSISIPHWIKSLEKIEL